VKNISDQYVKKKNQTSCNK